MSTVQSALSGPIEIDDAPGESRMSDAAAATLVGHHRRFLTFLENRVGSAADAEEILQGAYLKGASAADPPEGEGVVTWFYRILRNAVIDHYRRRDAERRALDRSAREVEAPSEQELHDTACECILDVLASLKGEYATILRRVDVDEQAIADVAAEQAISSANARVRLHRARAALRTELIAACGACGDGGFRDCACVG